MAMDQKRAIHLIERQIAEGKPLARNQNEQCAKWRRDTRAVLERIFEKDSRQAHDFNGVSFTPRSYNMGDPDPAFERAFRRGMEVAMAVLQSALREIQEFWDDDSDSLAPDPLQRLARICKRFHPIARQLRQRHSQRATLDVTDEYDVQDLIHALLLLDFEDVRAEEWAPSYAGAASRVDFLLKCEQIVVEVKKARKSLTAKEIGEQLIVDIQRYQAHPDCKALVCFVYDPEGLIGNPRGIENDLGATKGSLPVKVYIEPQ